MDLLLFLGLSIIIPLFLSLCILALDVYFGVEKRLKEAQKDLTQKSFLLNSAVKQVRDTKVVTKEKIINNFELETPEVHGWMQ